MCEGEVGDREREERHVFIEASTEEVWLTWRWSLGQAGGGECCLAAGVPRTGGLGLGQVVWLSPAGTQQTLGPRSGNGAAAGDVVCALLKGPNLGSKCRCCLVPVWRSCDCQRRLATIPTGRSPPKKLGEDELRKT